MFARRLLGAILNAPWIGPARITSCVAGRSLPGGNERANHLASAGNRAARFLAAVSHLRIRPERIAPRRIRPEPRFASFARSDFALEAHSTPSVESRSFKAKFPHHLFMRDAFPAVLLEPFLCLGDR